LIDGRGSFLTAATIKDANGRSIAHVERNYSVQPNAKNANVADIFEGKALVKAVPNPGGNLPATSATENLKLGPGKYTFTIEITVTTQAERQADLVAEAEASFK
jgi:hypothetical protein